MSSIPPPNWLGSILGTAPAGQRSGAARAAESRGEADRASFADRLADIIDVGDRDGQVYSDAEGGGGSGRSSGSDAEANGGDEQPTPGGQDSALDVTA